MNMVVMVASVFMIGIMVVFIMNLFLYLILMKLSGEHPILSPDYHRNRIVEVPQEAHMTYKVQLRLRTLWCPFFKTWQDYKIERYRTFHTKIYETREEALADCNLSLN